MRRQRRSPSSSVDRPLEDPAADLPPTTSGQRARESPAEIPIGQSALTSPDELSERQNQNFFSVGRNDGSSLSWRDLSFWFLGESDILV